MKQYFLTNGECWQYHSGGGRYQRFCKVPPSAGMPYTWDDAQKLLAFLCDQGVDNVRIIDIDAWRKICKEAKHGINE